MCISIQLRETSAHAQIERMARGLFRSKQINIYRSMSSTVQSTQKQSWSKLMWKCNTTISPFHSTGDRERRKYFPPLSELPSFEFPPILCMPIISSPLNSNSSGRLESAEAPLAAHGREKMGRRKKERMGNGWHQNNPRRERLSKREGD